MKRYLVMDVYGRMFPDHAIIEAESPRAALADWDARSYHYATSGAIVAEIVLERPVPPSPGRPPADLLEFVTMSEPLTWGSIASGGFTGP